jgi:hypothetical protein
MNAIIDALSPFGITDIDMPATPQRIWTAIKQSTDASGASGASGAGASGAGGAGGANGASGAGANGGPR